MKKFLSFFALLFCPVILRAATITSGANTLLININEDGASTRTLSGADEGAFLGLVSTINCTGSGVTCSWNDQILTVTVSASGGGGGGSSLRLERNGTDDISVSTINVTRDLQYIKYTASATFFVDLSTVAASTRTLQSQIFTMVSTNSPHFVQIANSTDVLQSQIFTILSTNAAPILAQIYNIVSTNSAVFTLIAQATGSSNLVPGSTNYIRHSTATTEGVFHVTSGTVDNAVTLSTVQVTSVLQIGKLAFGSFATGQGLDVRGMTAFGAGFNGGTNSRFSDIPGLSSLGIGFTSNSGGNVLIKANGSGPRKILMNAGMDSPTDGMLTISNPGGQGSTGLIGILTSTPTSALDILNGSITVRGSPAGIKSSGTIQGDLLTGTSLYVAGSITSTSPVIGQEFWGDGRGLVNTISLIDESTFQGMGSTITCAGSGISCSQSGQTLTLTVAGGGSGGGGSSLRLERNGVDTVSVGTINIANQIQMIQYDSSATFFVDFSTIAASTRTLQSQQNVVVGTNALGILAQVYVLKSTNGAIFQSQIENVRSTNALILQSQHDVTVGTNILTTTVLNVGSITSRGSITIATGAVIAASGTLWGVTTTTLTVITSATINGIFVLKSSVTLQGPIVSSVTAQSVNAWSLKSTNDPDADLVPKYDAATGGVTWSADNNSGGSGAAVSTYTGLSLNDTFIVGFGTINISGSDLQVVSRYISSVTLRVDLSTVTGLANTGISQSNVSLATNNASVLAQIYVLKSTNGAIFQSQHDNILSTNSLATIAQVYLLKSTNGAIFQSQIENIKSSNAVILQSQISNIIATNVVNTTDLTIGSMTSKGSITVATGAVIAASGTLWGVTTTTLTVITSATINGIFITKSSVTLQGPMVSSAVAQSINPQNLKSSNDPSDTFVPKYNAAGGNITWSADNNSAGNTVLIEGATNYIGNQDDKQSGKRFNISSATIDSISVSSIIIVEPGFGLMDLSFSSQVKQGGFRATSVQVGQTSSLGGLHTAGFHPYGSGLTKAYWGSSARFTNTNLSALVIGFTDTGSGADAMIKTNGEKLMLTADLQAPVTGAFTIVPGGNIGINTSTPTSMLDIVDGSITVRGTNAGIISSGPIRADEFSASTLTITSSVTFLSALNIPYGGTSISSYPYVEVPISPASLAPTVSSGGLPVATVQLSTNCINFDYVQFSSKTTGTTHYYQFEYSPPLGQDASSSFTFAVTWTSTEATTGNAVFSMQGFSRADGDSLSNATAFYWSSSTVVDAWQSNNTEHRTPESSGLSLGPNHVAGNRVVWRIYPNFIDTRYTLNARAMITGIRLRYRRRSYSD